MTARNSAFLGLLCLVAATPLAAQEIATQPAAERGRHSIVLEVDGGPQIGLWARQSDRTDLGLDLGVTGLLSEGSSNFAVVMTPAIKRYLTSTGALAPYFYFGVPLSYNRAHNDNVGVPDDTQQGFGLGGRAGFGLEWFPISQVSVGGHVGLQAHYVHWNSDSNDVFQLGTMSSGLRVHLYF